MLAEQHLQEGNLTEALKELQSLVRAQPAKADYRIFLFQLLAVLGQWDRALTQLNVAGQLDAGALAMVAMYRQVIACERLREAVFKGRKDPIIFGEPAEWIALLLQALKLSATGQINESQTLREQAFASAPTYAGKLNDTEFTWLADADSRLGPMIEAIVEGRYLWIPQERIAVITIEPPTDLRDLIWLPAHFSWSNGGESYGVLPSRYVNSYQADDPLLALSRKTVWQDLGSDLFIGQGQKLLTTDDGDFPLLEIRSISFVKGD